MSLTGPTPEGPMSDVEYRTSDKPKAIGQAEGDRTSRRRSDIGPVNTLHSRYPHPPTAASFLA